MARKLTAEHQRLEETTGRKGDWKNWGPYLSERAWGTVREDYSPSGEAWEYFSHDHARSRAYRWNEDGLAGICDRHQTLCLALALWNGHDPILKERLFGLTGNEGNHGEDVKEYYYYLDSTPTHSYMKMLYKYPHAAFPYEELARVNNERGRREREFELFDTGVFNDNRYFDVFVEYAKAGENDVLMQITAHNRGPEAADLHVLPTLWYRNAWSWGLPDETKPAMRAHGDQVVLAQHAKQGEYVLYGDGDYKLLFTDNETNNQRLFNASNAGPCTKDAFHEFIVNGHADAVSANNTGTKAAAHYKLSIPGGKSASVRVRLTDGTLDEPFGDFDAVVQQRKKEADEFYEVVHSSTLSVDEKKVQRAAFAGLLWTKQWYYFNIRQWLNGDPGTPTPPADRKNGRNKDWEHLDANSILSMPDKWEYPWFAAWDTAFHCIPLALVDSEFAKRQLVLMLREWYMHPNGQIPAYEWAFGDVNPPVHAWASWRVYKIEKRLKGKGDTLFLEKVFHKLLLNFTWWINRKDADGKNVFQGGFLGMDNIGVFDRSQPLPTGGHLEQSDSTSWMGMYCLNMMTIALELATHDVAYEDVATKFFEHFMYIAQALNNLGGANIELWSEKDGFFYDVLHIEQKNEFHKLRIHSMVGLIPLLAVETIEDEVLDALPRFKRRMDWFLKNRPDLAQLVAKWDIPGSGQRHVLSLLRGSRLKKLLRRMLDPEEFLSDYGIRSLSKFHEKNPYIMVVDGKEYRVDYEAGESTSGLFGGNSNWRGPIWFPVNYLLIESLQKFHHYYSDDFLVEHPTGSGTKRSLWDIALDLETRLINIFVKDKDGRRPYLGDNEAFQNDPHWRDHVQFYEFFHGDSGEGLGASHQTGWTAVVAKLMQQVGDSRGKKKQANDRPQTLVLSRTGDVLGRMEEAKKQKKKK